MLEAKIINDPVFGFIKIPRGLLYGIVEHPLFQRLNRINQLGLASVVYPGARHTRFQHSLGAFHLMSEAVLSLQQKGIFIFDTEAEAVQAAILMQEYADPRYLTRRYLTIDDGRDQPSFQRATESCYLDIQGRIPQELSSSAHLQSVRYGPSGLSATRFVLYRSDRR